MVRGSAEQLEALRVAHSCDVVAVNTRLDAEGRCLGLITREGEQWYGPEGGLVVAGAAGPWWQDHVTYWPTPSTMLECQATVLAITAAFHAYAYQRLGRTFAGLQAQAATTGTAVFPTVAQPYRGLTVSLMGVRRWRAVLPSDEQLYVVGLEKDQAPVAAQPAPEDRYRLSRADAKRQRRTTGRVQRIAITAGG